MYQGYGLTIFNSAFVQKNGYDLNFIYISTSFGRRLIIDYDYYLVKSRNKFPRNPLDFYSLHNIYR